MSGLRKFHGLISQEITTAFNISLTTSRRKLRVFSPLSRYRLQQTDKLLAESQGLVRLTKRDFWPLFRETWKQAFGKENVRSAWENDRYLNTHLTPIHFWLT
jgi:hypothetical protein